MLASLSRSPRRSRRAAARVTQEQRRHGSPTLTDEQRRPRASISPTAATSAATSRSRTCPSASSSRPSAGDATARIQAAIDHVASLPRRRPRHPRRGAASAGPLRDRRRAEDHRLRRRPARQRHRATTARRSSPPATTAARSSRSPARTIARSTPTPSPIADAYVPVQRDALPRRRRGQVQGRRRRRHPPAVHRRVDQGARHGRHGRRAARLPWKPGSRELAWDRTVTARRRRRASPSTRRSRPRSTPSSAAAPSRPTRGPAASRNVGVENLRCESAFDPANPKDENHAWFAITIENAARRVGAAGDVRPLRRLGRRGRASRAAASRSRTASRSRPSPRSAATAGTRSSPPASRRCSSAATREHGRHDFAVGFCAAGPNAFVQCEAQRRARRQRRRSTVGRRACCSTTSASTATRISLRDRRYAAQGAGWSAANSVLWQCSAAVIRCFSPPTATNWAVGCWATFDGDGVWQQLQRIGRAREPLLRAARRPHRRARRRRAAQL